MWHKTNRQGVIAAAKHSVFAASSAACQANGRAPSVHFFCVSCLGVVVLVVVVVAVVPGEPPSFLTHPFLLRRNLSTNHTTPTTGREKLLHTRYTKRKKTTAETPQNKTQTATTKEKRPRRKKKVPQEQNKISG